MGSYDIQEKQGVQLFYMPCRFCKHALTPLWKAWHPAWHAELYTECDSVWHTTAVSEVQLQLERQALLSVMAAGWSHLHGYSDIIDTRRIAQLATYILAWPRTLMFILNPMYPATTRPNPDSKDPAVPGNYQWQKMIVWYNVIVKIRTMLNLLHICISVSEVSEVQQILATPSEKN